MTRHTALILTHQLDAEESLERSIALLDDLFSKLPFIADPGRTELPAVAPATALKEKLVLPRGQHGEELAATPAGDVHHLFDGQSWHTPEQCPPAPMDSNGATGWQWLYFNTLHNTDASTICYLWDIHALGARSAA